MLCRKSWIDVSPIEMCGCNSKPSFERGSKRQNPREFTRKKHQTSPCELRNRGWEKEDKRVGFQWKGPTSVGKSFLVWAQKASCLTTKFEAYCCLESGFQFQIMIFRPWIWTQGVVNQMSKVNEAKTGPFSMKNNWLPEEKIYTDPESCLSSVLENKRSVQCVSCTKYSNSNSVVYL